MGITKEHNKTFEKEENMKTDSREECFKKHDNTNHGKLKVCIIKSTDLNKFYFQNDEKYDSILEANKKNAEEEEHEKPSKNEPSYRLWSIFTKQREIQKASTLKKDLRIS